MATEWAATPAGMATRAMYAAAEKAGMAGELGRAQAEVLFSNYCVPEKRTAYIFWEEELRENPEFVEPTAALARAGAWLKAYGAKQGLKVWA